MRNILVLHRRQLENIVLAAMPIVLLLWAISPGCTAMTDLPEPAGNIGQLDPPSRGSKIVIFAPHPDDETFGCGGYIQKAVQAGAEVRIVVVTNGEASKTALQSLKETPEETAQLSEELGTIRQNETLMGVGALGLPSSTVTFLGYPNRYLTNMWSPDNWLPENPIKSAKLNTPGRHIRTP